MKKIIATENAPKAVGPYSQAVMAGETLYISGQIPLDPKTMKIVGETAAEQAKQVFANTKAILEEAGLGFSNVVKMTVLLANIADFKAVNEVYATYFEGDFPARAAFQVSNLPLGVQIEIESIAYNG